MKKGKIQSILGAGDSHYYTLFSIQPPLRHFELRKLTEKFVDSSLLVVQANHPNVTLGVGRSRILFLHGRLGDSQCTN